ncbi:MAG TPA: xanthine dehydrogenase family protein molybdopterin-binding subunit, partial [Gemmatimonadales bacterium]|nr:xanthine dehydrogenase family protein molybdopterin-binding subunit [Gemmatimonadales bacterium]
MSGDFSRRDFVRVAAAAGGGLVLAVSLSHCGSEPLPPAAAEPDGRLPFAPDAWIRIGRDGLVTVVVDRSEMGQGVSTSLPMLVAEELEAEWDQVRYEFAQANPVYANPLFQGGMQATGGSTSVRAAWEPLRAAGARARMMLLAAAAARWSVDVTRCRAERGRVHHPDGVQSFGFGDLADDAAKQPVPEVVTLKPRSEWRLIGRPVPRLDLREKVTGTAVFGMDAGPPDALVAVVARCPVFGGTLRLLDDTAARAVPGVEHVMRIDRGVAVIARGYAAATRGRAALRIEWDEGPLAALDDAEIGRRLEELADQPGYVARREGDGVRGFPGGPAIGADYRLPYLAHATMEPMNCVVAPGAGFAEVWVPTQFQHGGRLVGGGAREAVAKVLGLPGGRVTLHTTHLGGGFGRRFELDVIVEAAQIARAVGAPVRLIWSREDDVRHDHYRPVGLHRMRAALGADGLPVAWSHRVVCPSIVAKFLPEWLPEFATRIAGPLKGGVDSNAMEGATGLPYAIPHLEISYSRADLGVPVGFWRSVGHSQNAFAVEGFIDEVAARAGRDPVAYRRALLGAHPRMRAVLDLAAERAGWGTPLPAGRGRGVAVHESFGSWVAEVAEVSVEDGAVRVHRVVCAVDCGTVVHPDTVAAQMESGLVYGLTAALFGKINIEKGRVRQSNFHDYRMLTMREMPAIEVHIVPSNFEPGGVGEPSTPPIAPAVVN